MALTWDVKEVKDYEKNFPPVKKAGRELWNPTTERVVWLCMFTDIGWQLTEKNFSEFLFRVRFLEQHDGYGSPAEPIENLRGHIGLQVNVSPLTRAKWLNKKKKHFVENVERNIKAELAEEVQKRAS